MIRGFFLLLLCQLVGEVLARYLSLPAPGPVIGLALLTLGLWFSNRRKPFTDEALGESDVGRAANALLSSLSLMFVPAGVGVVQYLGLIGQQGFALSVALIVSTVLTLLATVGVFLGVKRVLRRREGAA
jgi:putative effector of murein hydrolase LrgA (UPF0299 family)